MGVVVGLGLGVGLLLVWAAFAMPRAERRPRATPRLRQLLDRAGHGTERRARNARRLDVLGEQRLRHLDHSVLVRPSARAWRSSSVFGCTPVPRCAGGLAAPCEPGSPTAWMCITHGDHL